MSLLLMLSCTKSDPIEEVYSGCDPLDEAKCALPWPSTYHMDPNPKAASGWQVAFAGNSLPVNRDNVQVRPDAWNELDGFSTLGPMLAYFQDLDDSDLVGHEDIEASLTSGTIALINAETGEREPYFAELDATAENPDESLLIIRPVQPLDHATRYIVAIQGLSTTAGAPVAVSEGFAALRDGVETDSWDTEGRRAWFEDSVFPSIEALGWERGELQLAWDFVTVSEESSLDRVLWMRDDAADRVGSAGPAYTITEVQNGDCEAGDTIGKTLYIDMTVPMYTETPDPGTWLTRDADGMPYYNGDTTAEVMVRVPCSLLEEPEPAMVLQYGHGLLGSKGEARTGYLSEMADRYKWVIVASDWVGMYEDDVSAITLMLVNDLSDFAILPERSLQGFVEKDVALRMVRGSLANDPELMVDDIPLIDPERVAYYGNSQGAILGGGYVGMSDQIERAVLGVGGSPYAILLSRSADFDPFFLVFQAKYTDHRDIAVLLVAMQTLWDPAEAAGWATQMGADNYAGNPEKLILQQVGIGDSQVTTLGAHILARAYDSANVSPANRPIWGVDNQEAPFERSALVEWYYPDGSTEPVENIPPDDDGDTHECPRREPAAQDQLRDFVETGVVNNYCDGPCEGLREGFCD